MYSELFLTKKQFLGGVGAGVVGRSKQNSSQLPDMFPKEIPIAPHFYPICVGKYISGPKFKNSILQNRTFCFGESP
jgi:hypothetical protein